MVTAQGPDSFPRSARFLFRRRLGAGGFGVVYEVDDRERGTRVALKTLHHLDAAALYAFKREFRALCDVVHPNLVGLHELISEGDHWFFTMDLVEGTDFFRFVQGGPAQEAASTVLAPLVGTEQSFTAARALLSTQEAPSDGVVVPAQIPDQWIRKDGGRGRAASDPERWTRLRSALRQLAEGLSALHGASKLHRDLKPSNVLVTPEGKVVILDFGLVMDVSSRQTHPSVGQLAGTPAYMAPEQARGDAASPANDWYSLGAMLYEALTGQLPFDGTPLQVLMRKQQEDPAPPKNIVPGVPEDLDTLCVELLRRGPAERPSGAEVLRTLGPSEERVDRQASGQMPSGDTALFVGREKHLAALREACERARAGKATTVHVRGVSGMGKSALVRHFLEEVARGNQAVVLQGRCYERESVPYKAIDNLIDSLSRFLSRLSEPQAAELMPRDVHALVRLFPVLDRVKAVASAPHRGPLPPDAQELRRRGFAALRELFGRIADRKPLVVHIDDLQWGDADSALLLADLLREPDPPALLLLIGYRSEDADRSEMLRRLPTPSAPNRAAENAGDEAVRDLVVGALDREEALALARHVFGRADARSADGAAGDPVESIVEEAGGSPFFVHELARGIRERAGASGEIRLETVLGNRLSRLPVEAQSLLEAVAVAGRPLGRRIAREAAALSAEQESTAMGVLRAEHILRSRGTGDDEELETFHDRIRETAVARLDPGDLAQRHLRLATALETSGAVEPDMLALHFRRAERPDKAVPYAILAGDRAAEALAFDRAAALYSYSIETAPGDGEHERVLRIKLGDALKNAGRGAVAAKEYSAAAKGAPPDQSLDLRRRAAEQLLRSGRLDEGRIALRDVLASVGITLFEKRWLVLLSLLFWQFLIRIRRHRVRMRENGQVPAERLARLNLCWSATVGLSMTDFVQGAEFQARYLALALEAGDPHHLARGFAFDAGYAGIEGNRPRAEQVYGVAAAMASEVGDPYLIGFSRFNLAALECLTGQWTRGLAACREAELWLDKCSGVAWEHASTRVFLLGSHFFRGELREVLRLSIPFRDDAEARGDLHAATWFRVTNTFWAPLAADCPELARQEVIGAMARWWQQGFDLLHCYELLALARIDLYAGEPQSARRRLRESWPRVVGSLLMRLQMLRVLLCDLRASLALATAVKDDGDKRLRNALLDEAEGEARRMAREDVGWAVATSNARQAGVAWLRGNAASALSLLDTAASQFDTCEMALYAAAVRRRKGEIVGGDEGRTLLKAADASMAGQGIKNPARMTALFVPGFP